MTERTSPADFVGREPDPRLLSEDLGNLPEVVGHPETFVPTRARRRIVGTGATLTAASLIVGSLLVVVGAIEALSSGIGALSISTLLVGALLVLTHWGWVHVAEITANSIEGRGNAVVEDHRQRWLATIEPYTHFEIYTRVEEDGAITIYRVAHRPVTSGERRFTFERDTEYEEVHPSDEPAAEVAERAELLRREAAQDTERERERYQIAADAYEAVLLDDADEQQRRLAQRAASEALSHQINTNLREPPLIE
ncbi:MAG TPA: hypothetical protein VHZ27_03080 [Solirubrobacteraceae bacterium]|jgi:hypothetical protein|nr:hypothetical protein [Solirubrobacteraceae bacterium]